MAQKADIYEDIQKAIVDAGGRFLRRQEIKEMTVEAFLDLLVPNDIAIIFNFNKGISKNEECGVIIKSRKAAESAPED